MASRSAFDLAAVIGSLTELNDARKLAPRDREVLEKARKHLICEISEVTGETKNAAEERIDGALNRLDRKFPALA
jgi:RNA polymerase-interacting CarD/CdnL/TRCF family regulator